jgi:hypothetical protein
MVSRKDANELGREHNSKRPKSSSSYLTSIDTRSTTISLKIDMWLNIEPPSSIFEGPIRRTREGGSEWEPIKFFSKVMGTPTR